MPETTKSGAEGRTHLRRRRRRQEQRAPRRDEEERTRSVATMCAIDEEWCREAHAPATPEAAPTNRERFYLRDR